MIKIEVLDGKNCIGGNKILVSFKDISFFLDFGKNFKSWGNFFEEFLQPRSSVGIYDLWKLNLIPKFSNIYREDLIQSDFKEFVVKEKGINLKSVFLTHAHLDHSGFISILNEDIPVYMSNLSKLFLKSIEETGKKDIFSHFTKVKRREEIKDESGSFILKTTREENIKERNIVILNDLKKEYNLSDFKFKYFNVDHSILGALAYYFELNGVSISYTGDIRFHGKRKNLSFDYVNEIKKLKTDILIVEGTRANSTRENRQERDVYEASFELIKSNKGKLVIADFGARNIERLETFIEVGKETNRKILVNSKDAYLLHLLSLEGIDFINDEDLYIILEKRAKEEKYFKEVKEKYNSKIIKIKDVEKNPGDFILCYSFWDFNNLLDIEIKDGIYIYSSSEAFTEEQEFDAKRLLNWLKFFNLKPYGIEIVKDKPEYSGNYHSSGHSSLDDLIFLINEVNPKYIIPVHTENLEIFKSIFKDRVIENEVFTL